MSEIRMKPENLNEKKRYLKAKGYDLTGKDRKHIELLYGMYKPKKLEKQGKPWKLWSGTNRLHHYG